MFIEQIKQNQQLFQQSVMRDEHYRGAIANYLKIEPTTSAQEAAFAVSVSWNRCWAQLGQSWQGKENPYDHIEDNIYLGILPQSNLRVGQSEDPKDKALANKLHSIISLVDWHEYLASAFITMNTVQPSEWAANHINQLSIPMTDYTATLETDIAVDALFKIALLCQQAKNAAQVVYLHCKAGRARSAMMTALVLYHQHKYLNEPVDPNYTLEQAYATLQSARNQVSLHDGKKQTAAAIARALDNFYTTKTTLVANSQAELRNVTSSSFVWNHIAQLPALKTLIIKAQALINSDANHPDYLAIFKPFFEEIAACEKDWYQDLKKDTPTQEMHRQLKNKYPTEVTALISEMTDKIALAVASPVAKAHSKK